jgi:alkylhydroperoxidase family enzyme
MARVPFVEPDTPDPVIGELFATLSAQRGWVLHLYRALAHSPAALRSVMAVGANLVFVDGIAVPGDLVELLILRVAWLCEADYVWGRHRRAARDRGADDVLVAAITQPAPAEPLDARARATIRVADEIVIEGEASDDAMAALRAIAGEAFTVEVITLAASYLMVCRLTRSLGLDVEEGDEPRPS